MSYFATVKPSVLLVWRSSPLFFVLLTGLTLFSGLLPTVSIFINARLLGLLAQAIHATAINGALDYSVVVPLVYTGAVAVLGQAVSGLTDATQRLFQKRAAFYMQGILVEKTATLISNFSKSQGFTTKCS